MVQMQAISATTYSALRTGTAVQPRPTGGVLALDGEDRADFLQRMTTNNILALDQGQSCITVLTSPTAKIIQVFTVVARADSLWLLPAPGETDALARYLRGQIFFMDKVTVTDLSGSLGRLRVMGPTAADTLARFGIDMRQVGDGVWREQNGILAIAQDAYDVPGLEVAAPSAQAAALLAHLIGAGGVQLEDYGAYDLRRIELGRPIPGAELIGEYSPLEAGLAWACAENKGCYTGQEIIARQITYDKVTRHLVGLRSAGPMAVGTAVMVDDREVGMVTSTACIPDGSDCLALAVLKRPYDAVDTRVSVGGRRAEVAALPFVA